MSYSTAEVREFLTKFFNDDEITALCTDYFRDVADDFAAGQTKSQRIQLLIDYCERHEVTSKLHAALHNARPEQYSKQFPDAKFESFSPPQKRERDPKRIFLSHAHQDMELAQRLARDLKADGWQVWIAPDSIQPSEKWVDAIQRGLDECGVFLAILTPHALKSKWMQSETNVAIGLEHQGQMRVLPVMAKSCEVSGLLSTYQQVSFVGSYNHGLTNLLAALRQRLLQPIVVPPPVKQINRAILLIIPIVIFVCFAVWLTIYQIVPTPTPRAQFVGGGGGKIAFQSDRDGGPRLYLMNIDGTEQVELRRTSSEDIQPIWSPDGATIAFTAKIAGTQSIWRMNLDGSSLRQLTDNSRLARSDDWSPDGRRILFYQDGDIYMMNADGGNIIRLTEDPLLDGCARWSPDGTRVLFESQRDTQSSNVELYTMSDTGGDIQRLTTSGEVYSCADWSPDGRQIVFSRQGEIYVMKIEERELIRLTNNSVTDESPAWSPDGNKIAFVSRGSGGYQQIWLMDADGSNKQQLTSGDANSSWPAWQP